MPFPKLKLKTHPQPPLPQSRPQPPPPSPFRIAILGAGLAGLTTALFLHHHLPPTLFVSGEVSITIYEQATPDRNTPGAGIGLGVNAMRLLHKLGLGEACDAIAGEQDGVWFAVRRWDDGGEVVTLFEGGGDHEDGGDGGVGGSGGKKGDYLESVEGDHGGKGGRVKGASVARGELLGVLRRAVEERGVLVDGEGGLDGVKGGVRMGKRGVGVEDLGDDGVRINFEDGTAAEADLVIACDGIHSAIRGQFVRDRAVYSGKMLYRGLVPMDQLPSPWPLPSYSTMWVGPGKHVVVYAISGSKTMNFVGCVTKDEANVRDFRESWSLTCHRKEVEDEFGDCDKMVKKIIRLLPERPSKWLINDRDPTPEWTFLGGKVVLLGDAAHPMVPHQSAGGGQAIEDAYIISRALAGYLEQRACGDKKASLDKWMGLYQRVRLPRAQLVQETSRETGYLYHLQTPDMQGKTIDERLCILTERLKDRLKWIWSEDLDAAYDKAKRDMLKAKGWRRRLLRCFCM